MTPSLFDLPLRLGDTVALAKILIEVLGDTPRPVTDEQRSRAAARASAQKFDAMRVLMPSLERDPVHASAYYVCVDGLSDESLLLRIATARTPSSGLFPKSVLIGRTFAGPHEVVVNAVPFGPRDHERIQTYAEQINKAFQPRLLGSKAIVRIRSLEPDAAFPTAFEALRSTMKSSGHNIACFAISEGQTTEDFYYSVVWAAIRTGWRAGYGVQAYPTNPEQAKAAVRFTRFGVRTAEMIAGIRSTSRGPFDTELITTAASLESDLARLKEAGYSVQSVALGGEVADTVQLEETAGVYRAALNLRDLCVNEAMSKDEIVELLRR